MTGQQERPGTLAEALIALQARLPRITRDATGQIQSREYKYATLASIYDAVFPLLEPLGLFWSCCPTVEDGRFVLAYELGHVSGTGRGGYFPLPDGVSSQATGSAITYAERYSFNAVIGIAPADDDGAAATAEWHPPADPRKHRVIRERRTAAEDTDWTTGPAGDDTPGTITGDQLKEIRDRFVRNGIAVEDQPALVMSRLDLPGFRKFADLSRGQADNLIAYLRALENATEEGA